METGGPLGEKTISRRKKNSDRESSGGGQGSLGTTDGAPSGKGRICFASDRELRENIRCMTSGKVESEESYSVRHREKEEPLRRKKSSWSSCAAGEISSKVGVSGASNTNGGGGRGNLGPRRPLDRTNEESQEARREGGGK